MCIRDSSNNILGSIDINRGDYLVGWDTDQFPNNVEELVLPFYYIYKNGGFSSGGLNMDAKIRRQSIDPEDLFYAHIGSMDTCARTLIAVEKMINDGSYESFLKQRYESWNDNSDLMNKLSLEDIHNKVIKENINPNPKSGRQEYLENLINSFVE